MYCTNNMRFFFFFFNDTATTEIYTLSLHDALPISELFAFTLRVRAGNTDVLTDAEENVRQCFRSEERFSRNAETDLVCRLLLEKKKKHHQLYPYHKIYQRLQHQPQFPH